MTSTELFNLVRRRWYVYAFSLAMALAALALLGGSSRMYVAQTEISFSPPIATSSNASGGDERETLIDFAGVVARAYNAEAPSTVLSSPTASLFGNGVRRGVSVALSKTGNQWTTGFDRAVIDVRVIQPSPDEVLENLDKVSLDVKDITERLQAESGAPARYFINATVSQDDVSMNSFGPTRTGKFKGTVILITMAMLLGTLVAQAVNSLGPRKNRHGSPTRGRRNIGSHGLASQRNSGGELV